MSEIYNLILFTAMGIVLAPLGTLLHELGHAVTALRLTDGPVMMKIGGGKIRAARRLSPRFAVLLGSRCLGGGQVRHHPAATKRDAAVIASAGPAATLLAGLASGLVALRGYVHGAPKIEQYALGAFTVDVLASLLMNSGRNVVPTASGRMQPTDGEQVARLAGAVPTTAPKRTSPVAWVLLAPVGAMVVWLAFDDPATGAPMLVALAAIFLWAGRIERRQRAR